MMNWRNKEPRRTGAEGYSIAKDTENTSVSQHMGQLEDTPARFMHLRPLSKSFIIIWYLNVNLFLDLKLDNLVTAKAK